MTEIASHRGGALLWPENSRIAFENTAALAVEQVEFDLHPTRDGRLVVIHDPTLDRTTDAVGPVAERHWRELEDVVIKGTGGQRPLLLEEVIGIFRPTPIRLRIELKVDARGQPYPGLPGLVAAALDRAGMAARSVVTGFQLATVAEAMALAKPHAAVWLLAPAVLRDIGGAAAAIALARDRHIPMLGLHHAALNVDVVALARRGGVGIGGWACNAIETMAPMFALEVDVFTTDRPDLALALRADHRARE
ncbi:MAG: glycerophosphodiester phosphodiesterase [Alphaproteobacteria bacterium]|nr:glycerophosphodiester phosphodiesterase [Alphaproteobacteria bacterium]